MSSLNRLRLRGHIFICNLKIGYTKNQQFLNTNVKFIYILSNIINTNHKRKITVQSFGMQLIVDIL